MPVGGWRVALFRQIQEKTMHSESSPRRCSEILNAVFRFGRDEKAKTAASVFTGRERGSTPLCPPHSGVDAVSGGVEDQRLRNRLGEV